MSDIHPIAARLARLQRLDTNTVSYIINGRSRIARQKLETNLNDAAISAVTEGELRFVALNLP